MRNKEKWSTKKIVYVGLLAAMTFVLTRIFQIPIAQGYVHLGDSIVYFTAFMFGGAAGAVAGGIGGALADLTSFPVYTLPTLIIKSIMAFAAAFIYKHMKNKVFGMTLAFVCSGALMTFGYYITETVLCSSFITPLASVPMNLVQVLFSVPVPVILNVALKKKNI